MRPCASTRKCMGVSVCECVCQRELSKDKLQASYCKATSVTAISVVAMHCIRYCATSAVGVPSSSRDESIFPAGRSSASIRRETFGSSIGSTSWQNSAEMSPSARFSNLRYASMHLAISAPDNRCCASSKRLCGDRTGPGTGINLCQGRKRG